MQEEQIQLHIQSLGDNPPMTEEEIRYYIQRLSTGTWTPALSDDKRDPVYRRAGAFDLLIDFQPHTTAELNKCAISKGRDHAKDIVRCVPGLKLEPKRVVGEDGKNTTTYRFVKDTNFDALFPANAAQQQYAVQAQLPLDQPQQNPPADQPPWETPVSTEAPQTASQEVLSLMDIPAVADQIAKIGEDFAILAGLLRKEAEPVAVAPTTVGPGEPAAQVQQPAAVQVQPQAQQVVQPQGQQFQPQAQQVVQPQGQQFQPQGPAAAQVQPQGPATVAQQQPVQQQPQAQQVVQPQGQQPQGPTAAQVQPQAQQPAQQPAGGNAAMTPDNFMGAILSLSQTTGGQSTNFLPQLFAKYGQGEQAGVAGVQPENYVAMIAELKQLCGIQLQ